MKFFAYKTMVLITIIAMLLMPLFILFVFKAGSAVITYSNFSGESVFLYISFVVISVCVLAIATLLVFSIIFFFPIITINHKGVSKKLLWYKKSFAWAEIAEFGKTTCVEKNPKGNITTDIIYFSKRPLTKEEKNKCYDFSMKNPDVCIALYYNRTALNYAYQVAADVQKAEASEN